MPQPVDDPRWADLANPADVVEPPSGKKDSGWLNAEEPAHSYFNWLLNRFYQWQQYLKFLTTEALTWTALNIFTAGIRVTKSGSLLTFVNTNASIATSGSGANPALSAVGGSTSGAGIAAGCNTAVVNGGGITGNSWYGAFISASPAPSGVLGLGVNAVAPAAMFGEGVVGVTDNNAAGASGAGVKGVGTHSLANGVWGEGYVGVYGINTQAGGSGALFDGRDSTTAASPAIVARGGDGTAGTATSGNGITATGGSYTGAGAGALAGYGVFATGGNNQTSGVGNAMPGVTGVGGLHYGSTSPFNFGVNGIGGDNREVGGGAVIGGIGLRAVGGSALANGGGPATNIVSQGGPGLAAFGGTSAQYGGAGATLTGGTVGAAPSRSGHGAKVSAGSPAQPLVNALYVENGEMYFAGTRPNYNGVTVPNQVRADNHIAAFGTVHADGSGVTFGANNLIGPNTGAFTYSTNFVDVPIATMATTNYIIMLTSRDANKWRVVSRAAGTFRLAAEDAAGTLVNLSAAVSQCDFLVIGAHAP